MRTAEAVNLTFGAAAIGLLTALVILLNRMLKQQANLLGGIEAVRASLNDDEGEPGTIVRKEAAPPQEGLPIGAIAPKFSLATFAGDAVSLDDLLGQGKSVLLLFVSPNCWGCKVLLPAASVWQEDFADRLTVAAITKGSPEENRTKMARYRLDHLLIDADSKVTDDYHAKWSPGAVLIDSGGRIASHIAYGDGAIREWLREIISSDQVQPTGSNAAGRNGHISQVAVNYSARKIGEPAPDFALKDLSGNLVKVEDMRGSPTLLLFWHPRCEFCKTLSDDLRAWEENPPVGAPKLVFIAGGTPKDVRAFNKRFKSLTLLDPPFDLGPLFGTKYTPSAILIDSESRIASSLAIMADNVRALIGLPKAELPPALQFPEAFYGVRSESL